MRTLEQAKEAMRLAKLQYEAENWLRPKAPSFESYRLKVLGMTREQVHVSGYTVTEVLENSYLSGK